MALIAVRIGGSGGGYGGHRGGFQGYLGGSVPSSIQGPPFIVKLLQLPSDANDTFIEDLFKLRYTPVVKVKVVYDPLLSPLTSNVIRKVAFVELRSAADYQKVLKWHDCYYQPGKRVMIDPANFNDFQDTMRFNSDHADELSSLSQKVASNSNRWERAGSLGHQAPVQNRRLSTATAPPPQPVKPKPKPNPFGEAKPVDTLTKEKEIQKRLIKVNETTTLTVGEGEDPKEILRNYQERWRGRRGLERRGLIAILKRDGQRSLSKHPSHTGNNKSQQSLSEQGPDSLPSIQKESITLSEDHNPVVDSENSVHGKSLECGEYDNLTKSHSRESDKEAQEKRSSIPKVDNSVESTSISEALTSPKNDPPDQLTGNDAKAPHSSKGSLAGTNTEISADKNRRRGDRRGGLRRSRGNRDRVNEKLQDLVKERTSTERTTSDDQPKKEQSLSSSHSRDHRSRRRRDERKRLDKSGVKLSADQTTKPAAKSVLDSDIVRDTNARTTEGLRRGSLDKKEGEGLGRRSRRGGKRRTQGSNAEERKDGRDKEESHKATLNATTNPQVGPLIE